MNNHVIVGRQPNIIDIGRYFFNLFYTSMWYNVTVPTLEFEYTYIWVYILTRGK